MAQYERLKVAFHKAVINWRFYPAVFALQALRGIQDTSTVGMVSELDDLPRIENPQPLTA
jgi:hypothetical protein